MSRTKLQTSALLLALPSLVLAQEKITSGLQSATNWASVIVASAAVLALMYAAVQKMFGDPAANQRLGGVIVGGIIGLGASGLMQMLRMWFA